MRGVDCQNSDLKNKANFVEEVENQAGNAVVVPVAMHQKQLFQETELSNGKVACHHSLSKQMHGQTSLKKV